MSTLLQHLSHPNNMIQKQYSGGPLYSLKYLDADYIVSFSKNYLVVSTTNELKEVARQLVTDTHDDIITAFSFSDETNAFVSLKSGIVKQICVSDLLTIGVSKLFNIVSGTSSPVVAIISNSKFLVTSSLDGIIRVFNILDKCKKLCEIQSSSVTHNLLFIDIEVFFFCNKTASFAFEIKTKKQILISEDQVNCFALFNNQMFVTAGRNGHLNFYTYDKQKFELKRELYVDLQLQQICQLVHDDVHYIIGVTMEGKIVVIDCEKIFEKYNVVYDKQFNFCDIADYQQLIYCQSLSKSNDELQKSWSVSEQNLYSNKSTTFIVIMPNFIIVADSDCCIHRFDLQHVEINMETKQFQVQLSQSIQGEYGEILSTIDIGNNILFCCSTQNLVCFDVSSLKQYLIFGHQNVITQIHKFNDYFVSASADKIIIWNQVTFLPVLQIIVSDCQQLTSLSCFWSSSRQYLVFACNKQIKLLNLTSYFQNQDTKDIPIINDSKAITVVAHLDIINSLQISPSGTFIVSGSADKSIAIWSVKNHSEALEQKQEIGLFDIFTGKINKKLLIGVDRQCNKLQLIKQFTNLSRRTVWDVCFSGYQKVFAVACGDKRVRIFSYKETNESVDVNLIKQLEDFSSAVVKCCYISCGTQLVGLQQDGIFKVVNINSSETEITKDISYELRKKEGDLWFEVMYKQQQVQHNKKIITDFVPLQDQNLKIYLSSWSLLCFKDQILVGTNSGHLVQYLDITQDVKKKEIQNQQVKQQQKQDLQNCLNDGDYSKAFKLSLTQKDDDTSLQCIHFLQLSKQTLILIGYSFQELYIALKMSARWLKFTKRAGAAMIIVQAILHTVRIELFIAAYGNEAVQIFNSIQLLCGKHEERLESMRGEIRLLDDL